jgi:hypothetical protein
MYEVSLYTNTGKQYDFATFTWQDEARNYAQRRLGSVYQAQIVNTQTGNTTIFKLQGSELVMVKCYSINKEA